MTAALGTAPAAATTALPANPFAALTGRVKRIDQNELMAVGQAIAAAQQEQLAAQQALAAQGQSQAAALAAAQAPPVTTSVTPTAAVGAPTTAGTSTTTSAPTSVGAGTSAAAGSGGAVAIPSTTLAPRSTFDYWTKHIAQYAGKYLPDGPSMRPNCGPASATMALRMVGLDVPGFNGQNSEAVLDKARVIATGKNDTSVGTTDSELEKLINAAGGQWSESNNFDQMSGWVKQGIPVILSGNPSKGWNSRYSSDQVYPFNGGHWVTVSGYDQATGNYIVNDPLSQIGPIYVSEAELRSYNQAHGQLGIAVFR